MLRWTSKVEAVSQVRPVPLEIEVLARLRDKLRDVGIQIHGGRNHGASETGIGVQHVLAIVLLELRKLRAWGQQHGLHLLDTAYGGTARLYRWRCFAAYAVA